jgi:hypothetical protein
LSGGTVPPLATCFNKRRDADGIPAYRERAML